MTHPQDAAGASAERPRISRHNDVDVCMALKDRRPVHKATATMAPMCGQRVGWMTVVSDARHDVTCRRCLYRLAKERSL